jgi:putative DNA primase/helicase
VAGDNTQDLVQETVAAIKSHRFIVTLESGVMYVYDEKSGIYIPQVESLLHEEIEGMLQERATDHVVKEIIHKLQRTTAASIDDFDKDENLVHVGNGILDTTTMELYSHNRTHLSLRKISANYDPDAECVLFNKFLETSVEENDRVVIKQMLGFTLLNSYRYRRAFILVGITHTGKTTLMNTIIAFLGEKNTKSISLQSLCDVSSYDTHDLATAMANVHDDLGPEDIKNFGRLKQLTGDSRIRAREIYGKPFDFWNKAKLIFSCNEIPSAPRSDDAYYGRWVIIPMNRQFIEGSTADDSLGDKLKSPSELSGILNMAIDGLKMLRTNHGFSYPSEPKVQKVRYLAYSGDIIARFVAEAVVVSADDSVEHRDVYNNYCSFCETCESSPLNEIGFFMKLPNYLSKNIYDYRPSGNGRVPSFHGMRIVLPARTRPEGRFKYAPISIRPSDMSDDDILDGSLVA